MFRKQIFELFQVIQGQNRGFFRADNKREKRDSIFVLHINFCVVSIRSYLRLGKILAFSVLFWR